MVHDPTGLGLILFLIFLDHYPRTVRTPARFRSPDPAVCSEGVSQSRRPFQKNGKEWKKGEALRTLSSDLRGQKNGSVHPALGTR
jgi:hypothetical protein